MFEVSCHRSSVAEGIWGDVCFSNGDHANARIFYEKAVKEGCAIAQRNLGLFYEFGLGGTNKNVALAVKCYRQAVERGYPAAQADINRVLNNPTLSAVDLNNIGMLYHNGDGVKQDHAKAKRWYLKADAKGSEVAHRNLGSFFEYALAGEKRDLVKAAIYYQEAFNKGFRLAQFDLARLFQYPELSTPVTSADSGRKLTAMVGAAQIAAGAYITAMSAGALAPVGSALISSGANGIMHAVNAEDEEITAWKVAETSGKGAATGLISSGVSAGVDFFGTKLAEKIAAKTGEKVVEKVIEKTAVELTKEVAKKMTTDAVAGAGTTAVSAYSDYYIGKAFSDGTPESNARFQDEFDRKRTVSNIGLGGMTGAVGPQVNALAKKGAKVVASSVITKVVGDEKIVKEVVGKVGKKALDVTEKVVVAAAASGVTSASNQMLSNAVQGRALTEGMGANIALSAYIGAANGLMMEIKALKDKRELKLEKMLHQKNQRIELDQLAQTLEASSIEELKVLSQHQEKIIQALKKVQAAKLKSLDEMRAALKEAAGDQKSQKLLQQRVDRKEQKYLSALKNHDDACAIQKQAQSIIDERQQFMANANELTQKSANLDSVRLMQDDLLNHVKEEQHKVDERQAKKSEVDEQHRKNIERKQQLENQHSSLEQQKREAEHKLQAEKEHLQRLEDEQRRLDEEKNQLEFEIGSTQQNIHSARSRMQGFQSTVDNLLGFIHNIFFNQAQALRDARNGLAQARDDVDRFLVDLDTAKNKLAQNGEKSVHKHIDAAKANIATFTNDVGRVADNIGKVGGELSHHYHHVLKPLEEFSQQVGRELENASEELAKAEKRARDNASALLQPLEIATKESLQNIEKTFVKAGDDIAAEWKRLPPEVQTAIIVIAAGALAYGAVSLVIASGGEVVLGVQIGKAFVPVAKVGLSGVVAIASGIEHQEYSCYGAGNRKKSGSNFEMQKRPPPSSPSNPSTSEPPPSQPGKNPPPKPQAKPQIKPVPTESAKPENPKTPENPVPPVPETPVEKNSPEAKKEEPSLDSSRRKTVVDDAALPDPKPPLSDVKHPSPAHESKHSNNQRTQYHQRLAAQQRALDGNAFFKPSASSAKNAAPHHPPHPGKLGVDAAGMVLHHITLADNTYAAGQEFFDRLNYERHGGCDKPTIAAPGDDPDRRCARQKAEEVHAREREELSKVTEQINEAIRNRYRVRK